MGQPAENYLLSATQVVCVVSLVSGLLSTRRGGQTVCSTRTMSALGTRVRLRHRYLMSVCDSE